MNSHFINEGVTLIIESETQRMAIEVDDDNRELCLELDQIIQATRPQES